MTREEAIKVIEGRFEIMDYCESVRLEEALDIAIESLKQSQPRKTGRWILDEDPHDGDCRCSACLIAIGQMHERNHSLLNELTGGKWWTFYKYCPNCGSYNGGEEE